MPLLSSCTPGQTKTRNALHTTGNVATGVLPSVTPSLTLPDADVVEISDVVYGRKHGMALTMNVFTPRIEAKGTGVIWVVNGGWFSSRESVSLPISRTMIKSLTGAGYTVFAIVTSSQPKFAIPDMVSDVRRAVRFVRYKAAEFNIDPGHIGLLSASSGGHLALLHALAADNGVLTSKDPVEAVSSRVQAVACFFPPTDFLNYGKPGVQAIGSGPLSGYRAAFATDNTEPAKLRAYGRLISPITHATADDPPVLLIHGARDELVPFQQSASLAKRLSREEVPVRLIPKHGRGHGWPNLGEDMPAVTGWFDKYLLVRK